MKFEMKKEMQQQMHRHTKNQQKSCKQPHDNSGKIQKKCIDFLDINNLPKWSPDNTENQNGPITDIQTETMINLPHTQVKEKPGLKGLIAEFY